MRWERGALFLPPKHKGRSIKPSPHTARATPHSPLHRVLVGLRSAGRKWVKQASGNKAPEQQDLRLNSREGGTHGAAQADPTPNHLGADRTRPPGSGTAHPFPQLWAGSVCWGLHSGDGQGMTGRCCGPRWSAGQASGGSPMDTARGQGLAPSLPTSLAQAESPRPHGIAHGPQDAASEAV